MGHWNIGDKIQNRWEIHKIFGGAGKSGMGIVYVVYDQESKEVCAAKTFQKEALARDPRISIRFQQEALAWVNLDAHPNVVKAHFVQIVEGQPFLFLEYVSGGDLSRWIGTPRLTQDLAEVLRLAVQFCDGMEHVFSKGIVAHRDIKPANCLVTEDGILSVSDFGLAKVFDGVDPGTGSGDALRQDFSSRISLTGQMAGTLPYMAPEQFVDAKHVDARADIYAFGVMLFEMVTGRLPFTARTSLELQRQHRDQAPPGLGSGVGAEAHKRRELQELIHTCLAKKPEERPVSFAVLRERLASFFHQLTGREVPPSARGEVLNSVPAGLALNVARLNNKSVSLFSLGRKVEAFAALDASLQLNPRHAITWSHKAYFLHALGRMEESLAACEAALKINPRYLDALINKGNTLLALGRKEEALAACEAALEINPRSETALSNKGNALIALGRKEEALAAYETALLLNPRFENAWTNKGTALIALGRNQDALVACEMALQINPRSERAWYHKGLALEALGKKAEALVAYEAEIRINPRYSKAWFNKGALLLNEFRRYTEALRYFEQAHELGLPNVTQAIAICRSLLPKETRLRAPVPAPGHPTDRPQGANDHHQTALPTDTAHKSTLITTHFGAKLSGWFSRVQKRLPKAGVISVESPEELLRQGMVAINTGRPAEALAHFDRAVRLNPSHGEAWFRRGLVLISLQRWPDAFASLERAEQLGQTEATGHLNYWRRKLGF